MHLEARKATSREGGFDHRREPFLLVPVTRAVAAHLTESHDRNWNVMLFCGITQNSFRDPLCLGVATA